MRHWLHTFCALLLTLAVLSAAGFPHVSFAGSDPGVYDLARDITGPDADCDLTGTAAEDANCAAMAGHCSSFISAEHGQSRRTSTQTSAVFGEDFSEFYTAFPISEIPPPRA
ncbi:hypothetical protein [Roseovarius pelagicus]|uniref:Uncharacterized protein n=1 Tax=Roseovarius pelagicus TaxID=2980108 RepID=A0ABY6DJ29_9RHOB|nr:hypothetical protein [Roseovarius pelagicus]UXX85263.1 hypothetical protein N7U68_20685 [Roseovarius pelagicus]